mmetsp:Transcript_41518/g.75225  ORF Transcript_41518/g.75225 Transcript_41518/m.75225 type:complete len:312 (-) Transcript_41518:24-959(-)
MVVDNFATVYPEKQSQPSTTLSAYKPHQWQSGWLVFLGAIVPFGIFTTIFSMCTFRGNRYPGLVSKTAVLAVNFSIVGAWPQRRKSELVGRSPWDFAPMICCLCAVLWALVLGPYMSEMREPWERAHHLQQYNNVLPDSNPLGYSDAGIIFFSPESRIAGSLSAGYRVWPHRYCAAPIMTNETLSNDSSGASVGFWAVGMDCCDSRGDFECGNFEGADERGALSVDSEFAGKVSGHAVKEHYDAAVRMAAAAAGLKVSKGAILLKCDDHPSQQAAIAGLVSYMVYVFFELFALGCCWVMRIILLRMYELRK